MYAVIQRYRFDPHRTGVITQQLHTGFMPLLRRMPGFAAYYWLDDGDGNGAALSVWEDAATAERAVHVAADFASTHLANQLGTPEIAVGEIRIHVTSGL